MGARFRDREAAGRELAALLRDAAGLQDALVLGLPRGGVPVAAPVAVALGAELDVLVVRKLGVPSAPELAMGAVAGGGGRVLNDDVLRAHGVPPAVVERVTRREQDELARRERDYRGDRPPLRPGGRTVVVVDDGLATGASVRAAVQALQAAAAARVVVAVPVGSAEGCRLLAAVADEVVCPYRPEPFGSVSRHYRDFAQTTDAEVRALLQG